MWKGKSLIRHYITLQPQLEYLEKSGDQYNVYNWIRRFFSINKLTADNSGPSITILMRQERLVSLSLLQSLVLICFIWLSTEAVHSGRMRIMLSNKHLWKLTSVGFRCLYSSFYILQAWFLAVFFSSLSILYSWTNALLNIATLHKNIFLVSKWRIESDSLINNCCFTAIKLC